MSRSVREQPNVHTRRPAASRPEPVDGPRAERLVRAVAFAFLEIEAGRRPLDQIAPLLAPALRARLAASVRRAGPGPALDAVLSVRTTNPSPDVCDAAVVVRRGERVGVLAVRVERHRHLWRVVEIARPEDGHPAAATCPRPPAPAPAEAWTRAPAVPAGRR
ncbi:MAG TPA: Rv3235 family protein [Nitriliruptorales bacterium]|nr:Rv3235 family protein [Nitriliruptorales bacterium]